MPINGDARFEDLGLDEWLVETCRKMGIKKPTPVQSACIPQILKGRDVMGSAQTGSGKTAAFALPILQQLSRDPYGVYALVVTPTRELAYQIADQFRAFGSPIGVREAVVVGGTDMMEQSLALSRRPHLVIATPGRLLDHLNSATGISFARLKFLVCDEADRLFEGTILSEMEQILEKLPPTRQTLLFSATMTKTLAMLQEVSQEKAFVFDATPTATTVDTLKQQYVFMPEAVKDVYLVYLLRSLADKTCIVFVPTCQLCEFLGMLLKELEMPCVALHSYATQQQRLAALAKFKIGAVGILIATDVASRGLDIPTVDAVINYNVPAFPKDYIHRVGRTARAGRSGRSVTLVSQYEVDRVQTIETLTEKKMEAYEADEEEVLDGLNEVITAKRIARLKLIESGFGERQNARKEKDKMRKRMRREDGDEAQCSGAAEGAESATVADAEDGVAHGKEQHPAKKAAHGTAVRENENHALEGVGVGVDDDEGEGEGEAARSRTLGRGKRGGLTETQQHANVARRSSGGGQSERADCASQLEQCKFVGQSKQAEGKGQSQRGKGAGQSARHKAAGHLKSLKGTGQSERVKGTGQSEAGNGSSVSQGRKRSSGSEQGKGAMKDAVQSRKRNRTLKENGVKMRANQSRP